MGEQSALGPARARYVRELTELRRRANLSANDISTWISHRKRRSVAATTIVDWFKFDPRIPRSDEQFVLVLECLHTEASVPWSGTALARWKKLRAEAYAEPRPTPSIDPSGPSTADHFDAAGPQTAGSRLMVVGRIPRRAPHFIDRSQVRELEETLTRCTVAVVVCGMRGAGKTQVAAAYAREIIGGGGPGMVAWVNAETPEALYTGLADIADRVGVADPEGDSTVSARRLRDYLSERRDAALVVLDNATDPDLLDTVLPADGMTRVVVTSTDRAFDQFGELVDVGEGFARVESVRYLQEATGLDDERGAGLVAADLGDLPLALSAAAATIKGRRLDYPRYRRLLAEGSLAVVLPRRRGSDHPLAVDQALLLAVRTIGTSPADPELDVVVRWLLGVLSMLAPDGVERAMLPDRDGRLDEALQRCVEGSLLSRSTGNVVVMHRLLARVLRERTSPPDEPAADATAVLEALVFDESEAFARRAEGSRLIDHIEALWLAIDDTADLDQDLTARLLGLRSWAPRQLIKSADITRSIAQAHHTLTDHERVLGADHPDTLASRNDLAYAYRSAGQHGKAIPLFEQNTADRERVLGNDDPDTLASRNNLAYAYQEAGRFGEAILLYERNLADRERVLGADHPDTLASRNNLAFAYASAGRLGEAIPMHEQNLADCERVLETDQPGTMTSRDNLANTYRKAGRLGEAIPLFERNLADRERVLGADHPDTLASRNNLAFAYASAGRLNDAIPLCEQNLADRQRVLGNDHPGTLIARNNLAYAYESAGRRGEAIPLYEQNFAERQRVLGNDHPDTLIARNNLANAYQAAGGKSAVDAPGL